MTRVADTTTSNIDRTDLVVTQRRARDNDLIKEGTVRGGAKPVRQVLISRFTDVYPAAAAPNGSASQRRVADNIARF